MRNYGITNAAPYASAPPVGASGDTYWNTTSKTLYVSDGIAWIPWPSGGSSSPFLDERCFLSATTAVPAVSYQKVPFDSPVAGSVNFNTALNRWICPAAGKYAVNAGVMIASPTGTQLRFMVTIYINGVEARRGTDYTLGVTGIGSGGGLAYDTFSLNAGDYVEIYTYIQASITGVSWVGGTFPRTSYFSVRAIAPTGIIGPAGPAMPVYANAAARDAAIPTPYAGQSCVVLSDVFPYYSGLQIYRTSPVVGWFPPWNSAWGMLSEQIVTTGQNIVAQTVDITGLTTSFPVLPGRKYKCEVQIAQHSFNATGLLMWQITDAANNILASIQYGGGNVPIAQYSPGLFKTPTLTYASAGNQTCKVRAVSGSTDVRLTASATQPHIITVYDEGGAT